MEQWAKIGIPFSKYSISDRGRVRNDSTGYIFNNKNLSCGYVKVSLVSDDGLQTYHLVHRLVASAFLDGEGDVVHHVDGNRRNNFVENLQYTTQKNNCLHARQPCLRKSRAVLQCDLEGNPLKKWESVKDIPFNHSNVIGVCAGRLKTAYGYVWKYADDVLPGEMWKTTLFDGKSVKVSSAGRVELVSGKRTFGWKLNGYRVVSFGNKSVFVHRLVCAAFHYCDCSDKMVVNHKDFNKENNSVENLEWASQRENCLHGLVKKRRNVRRSTVKQILGDGAELIYPSIEVAARTIGVSKGNICSVCRGLRQTAGGYKWEYVENQDVRSHSD